MDARKHYRQTIEFLQYDFHWNAERLKEAKNLVDLQILRKADVIGMTTTGRCGKGALLLHMNLPFGSLQKAKNVRALLGLKLARFVE